MVAATARRLFLDKCTPTHLRRLLGSGERRDAARWQAIVDAGLTTILVPECAAGMGLAEIDFVQVAEAAGYVALPEPLVESAGIAVPMLAAIDPSHPLLLDTSLSIAIAHPCNPWVADADGAAALLMYRGGHTYLIDGSEVSLTRQESIDPFRRLFEVHWRPAAPITTLGSIWDDALNRGALFAAAQCLGLAQRTLDLAVDYAKTRSQFGKPIGSYQAIKHLLATVLVKLEFARPVLYAAAAQFALNSNYSRALISHAKLVAAEVADLSARTAIQVHGAMGMTWEVDLHFFFKRTLALTYAWGDPAFHRGRLQDHVLPVESHRTAA